MSTVKPIEFSRLKAMPIIPSYIEIVRYWDGLCYVNVRPVITKTLPRLVTYAKLKEEIDRILDIKLPEFKDLIFTHGERKSYAYVVCY